MFNVEIVASTLTPLATQENCALLESILISLGDGFFQDGIILDEDEEKDRHVFHKEQTGFLFDCIQKEIVRSSESGKVWREHLEIAEADLRTLGSVHFLSSDGQQHLHVHFDDAPLAEVLGEFRFGNSITLQWATNEDSIHSVVSACEQFFDNVFFVYGYCCDIEQYTAKNIDTSDGGMRAVGLDASKHLPGFYWGNYFGEFLTGRIGEDRLSDVPGCNVSQIGNGVLVVSKMSLSDWGRDDFLEVESRAVEYLGAEKFFPQKGIGSLFGPSPS